MDFLVTQKSKPWISIEVKSSEEVIDTNFITFCKQLNLKHHLQVVGNSGVYKVKKIEGIDVIIIGAESFLQYLV